MVKSQIQGLQRKSMTANKTPIAYQSWVTKSRAYRCCTTGYKNYSHCSSLMPGKFKAINMCHTAMISHY